jgi:pantoate--beta-alanine ligase
VDRLDTPNAMTNWARGRERHGVIGLVPTMGFLHDGHASLMRRLRPLCDHLVVSVFVNPLQFGPNEDLDRYPRDPEGDLALCERESVDAVFMPTDLYPDGFATQVAVHGLTDGLCGAGRPGHFAGVTTVCARLFGLTRCRIATFGEKDFQQLMVLRRMVEDLALPVRIVPAPLVRDRDGLALSSRNKYLSADERRRGLTLHQALFGIADAVERGQTDVATLVAQARDTIHSDGIEYLEVVDARSLAPLTEVGDAPARALVAARYGSTRLIDNVAVGARLSWD